MRRETLLVAGGLALVAGGSLLWFKFSGDAAQEAVVVVGPPPDPSETANVTGALPPAGAAALPSESEPVDDGKGEILVTTRLSSIYGNPSASAPVLYAFPAGRQLRVLGREGSFARIKELQSGATGWVDERILAPGASATASTPPALSAPTASTEPAGESQPAATQPAKPRPSASQRAATRPPATQRTASQPPLAASGAPQAQAQKQAAKRGAQRAERQGVFPDFLKRAFGGR